MPFYVYTLSNSNRTKYFIGLSSIVLKNPKTHFECLYPDLSFLQDNPMVNIISTNEVSTNFENVNKNLDERVVRTMGRFGILNVRGGSFHHLTSSVCSTLLSLPELRNKKHICLYCAKRTHGTEQCTEYNSDDDSDYVPDENEEEEESTDEECTVSDNTDDFIDSFS